MIEMIEPLTSTSRDHQLAQWAAAMLGRDAITLESLGGDAGFRRYFRFEQPSQWLAVDAPPASEDTGQFVQLAAHLRSFGVKTPKILAFDKDLGFLLVEDFGDNLLYRQTTLASADKDYQLAISTLLTVQSCSDNPRMIPRYDQPLLRREMNLLGEWFVEKLLAHPLQAQDQALLNHTFSQLEATALAQPQVFVHRDFHSRNLIMDNSETPKGNDSLGVIDFQGALWGPCTYDLVSLLKDCYLRWPTESINSWALTYYRAAIARGIVPVGVNQTEFLQWFDWMGLQRHIKVLGIFARLHLRDHKPHYLQDLPLVIRYTLETTERYPALQPFAEWFRSVLLPLIEEQPWYSDYQQAGTLR